MTTHKNAINPRSKSLKITPMMQQYQAAKIQNPDALLFFRLGDFYEMFYDDATTASKILGLTMTHRQDIPMCGVPAHSVEPYLQKLVQNGYRVAVVDQIGDPKAKGLTEREITKIVTPGTILTDDSLNISSNNFLSLIFEKNDEIALACADVSTGEFFYSIFIGKDRVHNLFDELFRLSPHEILFHDNLSFYQILKKFSDSKLDNCAFTKFSTQINSNFISQHFSNENLPETAQLAVEFLLNYLHNTIRTDLNHISKISRLDNSFNLILDAATLKNLEIIRNIRDNSKKNTLYDILDATKTPLGTRLLRRWLESPLIDLNSINRRLDAVDELFNNFSLRQNLREILKNIRDIERLMTKIEINSANANDLTNLKFSLKNLPKIIDALKNVSSDILIACRDGIKNFSDEISLIDRAIEEEAPTSIRDGAIIKRGFDENLDEYRKFSSDNRNFLQDFEENEKIKTGIRSLKVGYNRIFGYFIEVRHSGASKIPENYIRKQTLRDFEEKILGAQEKIVTLEYNIFCQVRDKIKLRLNDIQESAKKIAIIDAIQSFAEIANVNNYVRPNLNFEGKIQIKDGRHPLVEKILKNELFVPNDTNLNKNSSLMIITGPNMAGKSTYMRQVALITLMTQAGSFVPANFANISPVDRIFTRIGAGDDIVSGQSTFMVEMNEVANILKFSTEKSLIILDEVGRGTSTFDGMSIARAVIEYIDKKICAKTLFATHYHELTDLENFSDKIQNFSVAVKERGNEIIFLRRIKKGGADKSYGIQVAKLAGLPKFVMNRAEEILKNLEENSTEKVQVVEKIEKNPQMPNLFVENAIKEFLKLDVTTLTPIEAMSKLYELQKKLSPEEV